MSRNGSGTYVLPAGNPVVTGTVITSTWANTTMSDIATALTGSIASDGQTVVTGNLKLGNNRITGMADGIAPTDAATVAQTTNANIVSGTINGVTIGNVAPAIGTFSTLIAPTQTVTDSTTKVATTKFVHDLLGSGGDLRIIYAFGVSKTPAQLPANGLIPVNWDSAGNPTAQIQFQTGQCAIYNLCSPSAQDYNDVFSYSAPAQSWVNIGPVEGPVGPVGPQGPQGAQGVQGPKGDTGAQGPAGAKGDTGNDGPQGIAGPQGPIGNTGPQGPAGEPAVLVGSFGASKVPADLPANGFIPANWDSPGNPPTDRQLTVGQALIYADCPPSTPNYGHVYSYVGVGFDANGWIDCGDIVGPQGPQGPQGIQGPQGNNGTDGQQGPQGIQGIQGPKGDTGAQGPQGPAGSDATVTGPAVISALGFTPANLDGSNATGTWGINISGNSTSCSGNSATATLAANATNATNATTAANCTGNSATATNPQSGGTFITSDNIGSQSVSHATTADSATTAGNGGVTSVNGQTGAVSIPTSTGTVTSIATGNGLQGGTITTSGTLSIACPEFNSIGSYAFVVCFSNSGGIGAQPGANYAAGNGPLQMQSNCLLGDGTGNPANNLSGTWKWMSSPGQAGSNLAPSSGIACRIS